ncbi:gene transfer agent family protein [Xanthobacter autotrophicus DSM 597]|uniref:gene transfer agent family protein n=1 Tax=Xanthobacter wiegelii TaxID=3119913 RepID=UPI0037278947
MAAFDARVVLPFGDGDQTFRLALAQLLELQEKTNAGPMDLFMRLRGTSWRVEDIHETLRLGLIGGGMSAPDALRLVQRYAYPARPLLECVPIAAMVVGATLSPPEGESVGRQPGKEEAEAETGVSPPPPSTEPAPSSGSAPMSSEA